MNRRDRGAVVCVVAVVIALGATAMLVVAELTVALVEAARARTSADAVALAAAQDGIATAHQVAAANGATVLSVVSDGESVRVEVRVGRATARARATNGP